MNERREWGFAFTGVSSLIKYKNALNPVLAVMVWVSLGKDALQFLTKTKWEGRQGETYSKSFH